MAGNKSLHDANRAKNDEFYTQLSDIENELKHYTKHFKGKTVLCNCDDPRVSNFFHYFSYNFEYLGLKKLITTCYKNQARDLFSQNDSDKAIYLEYNGDKDGNRVPDVNEIGVKYLQGDGDFRSPECIELLQQADIVVTNPPFSLFRDFLEQLIKYDKKFLIIGNQNAIICKEIFPLAKENKIWLGYTFPKLFCIPLNAIGKSIKIINGIRYQQFGNICWYTNLDIEKRHEDLILYQTYKGNEEKYPKYDNYNAINVAETTEIPIDYHGIMGVPVTFLNKYNPEQFEIIWQASGNTRACAPTEVLKELKYVANSEDRGGCGVINGIRKYSRILIRNKKVQNKQ